MRPKDVDSLLRQAVYIGSEASIQEAFICFQMTYNWRNQHLAESVRRCIVEGQVVRSAPDEMYIPPARLLRRDQL